MQAALALSRQIAHAPPVWVKGVGTAFEMLLELGGEFRWTPITDASIVDPLGLLCATNYVDHVEYQMGGRAQRITQGDDGLLHQTDVASGSTQYLRLVPFFFEYEAANFDWRPFTEPEAIMALTAVLASSSPKQYTIQGQRYSASLVNEQGLMIQTAEADGAKRELRATPIGPDGQPHFEYLEEEHDWRPGRSTWQPVSANVTQILAACAAGQGDAYYTVGSSTYHAKLGEDGFVDQRNIQTGSTRPLRPAPWLGHGAARVADPTNGYIPQGIVLTAQQGVVGFAPPETVAIATPVGSYQPATTFYSPAAVPMGTMAQPVMLPVMEPVPMQPQPLYFYRPPEAQYGMVQQQYGAMGNLVA